jgi:hypothetical protein
MRRKERIGIVIDEDEDEARTRYCPACESRGYLYKLGAKIIEQGKEPEPDHDLWLQCYHCFGIVPKFSAKSEQTLEGFTEPTENPFEDDVVIESIEKRTSPAGKKKQEKRKKEKYRAHSNDREIDELLRIYGEDNVKVLYDSMPDVKTS